ncbi:hypothetical protein GCM10009108_25650 [Castellaniella ginsengisoli]|uniref:Uncharacterized protein n=1 Tax=Castellaniella ginsengisoli TaxID=546114 RepID=A0ABP3WF95_9BURK
MGEVDQLEHPVDHRVAQGNQGIDAADRDPVDELLEDKVHRSVSVVVLGCRDPQRWSGIWRASRRDAQGVPSVLKGKAFPALRERDRMAIRLPDTGVAY